MIVRMYQAEIASGRGVEFFDLLRSKWLPTTMKADGFLGIEFYQSVDGPNTIVVITRWRDETALEAWAGPLWQVRPVNPVESFQLLTKTDRVQHFVSVDVGDIG
jgi:hypothetical protein